MFVDPEGLRGLRQTPSVRARQQAYARQQAVRDARRVLERFEATKGLRFSEAERKDVLQNLVEFFEKHLKKIASGEIQGGCIKYLCGDERGNSCRLGDSINPDDTYLTLPDSPSLCDCVKWDNELEKRLENLL